jgi:hypothetical protein
MSRVVAVMQVPWPAAFRVYMNAFDFLSLDSKQPAFNFVFARSHFVN